MRALFLLFVFISCKFFFDHQTCKPKFSLIDSFPVFSLSEAGYDFVQHHLSNFCPSFSFFFILPSNRTFNYYKLRLKSKHGEDLITLDLDGSQRENDHNLGDISDEVQILLQGFS